MFPDLTQICSRLLQKFAKPISQKNRQVIGCHILGMEILVYPRIFRYFALFTAPQVLWFSNYNSFLYLVTLPSFIKGVPSSFNNSTINNCLGPKSVAYNWPNVFTPSKVTIPFLYLFLCITPSFIWVMILSSMGSQEGRKCFPQDQIHRVSWPWFSDVNLVPTLGAWHLRMTDYLKPFFPLPKALCHSLLFLLFLIL